MCENFCKCAISFFIFILMNKHLFSQQSKSASVILGSFNTSSALHYAGRHTIYDPIMLLSFSFATNIKLRIIVLKNGTSISLCQGQQKIIMTLLTNRRRIALPAFFSVISRLYKSFFIIFRYPHILLKNILKRRKL